MASLSQFTIYVSFQTTRKQFCNKKWANIFCLGAVANLINILRS